MDALAQRLEMGAARMGISLDARQRGRLLDYLALLSKWNKAYNLTAVRDTAEMVDRHLLDSLSILPYVTQGPCIDVGSGAGLPGIPLAIMRPDLAVTLLDSNGKKSRFQFQAKAALQLANLTVVNARVEDYQPPQPFACVLSRAFATLQDMVRWTQHLCGPAGHFLAMKGQYPAEEIAALPAGFVCQRVEPLQVPGCDGERHLVVIQRQLASTP